MTSQLFVFFFFFKAIVRLQFQRFEIYCERHQPNIAGRTLQEGASDLCASRGGHLAHIDNQELHDGIRNRIIEKGADGPPCIDNYGFWIGMNDIAIEGDYVWTDGTPTCFSGWANGEPNNNAKCGDGNGQDCAQLWFRREAKGLFDDECCDKRPKGIICEMTNYSGYDRGFRAFG
ncbi:perlucin-like protein [Glandiceps talaboti]